MATGTKLMKEISDQFLICKICLEPFKEPKTLSCLHTFCCDCVQQQYEAESSRPSRYTLYTRSITCPLCRKKTDLPTGGVRRLPDNFLVSNLTEVLAKRRGASKVPPCEICHTVRPRCNDACSKCLDCDKLLCRACVDLHASTKVTQDHSLIDLEGQKDIECKAHPEETVRFYCEKCEECICVVCTFQEHKDHDVCSFNDGFAKHRVTLESLLTRSKERLSGLAHRLKVIDRYETLSKELKERIRDLAISYTAQVRAREKELIRQVDELLGGDLNQLAQNKPWLQESFDSLQSACNLTEIVMKDKGVELLLLKKEIQGKMNHLLGGVLPAEPQGVHLDVQFVPGEMRLGDVVVPGQEGELKGEKRAENGELKGSIRLEDSRGTEKCRACTQCHGREKGGGEVVGTRGGDSKETKSVYIQTRPQDASPASGTTASFTASSAQINLPPGGTSVSHSSMQTHTATVSSRHAATDSANGVSHAQSHSRARGTMTERTDVRTLKTQTDDSCLRDQHLGQAAATGSSYPNTGAAIAAAFLRHRAADEDPLTRSWPPLQQETSHALAATETRDAQVATDISLGLDTRAAEAVAALTRTKAGSGESSRPDLLAETGIAAAPAPTSPSPSPWIRSRKVQTDVSAAVGDGLTDAELSKSLFASPGSGPDGRLSNGAQPRDRVTSTASSTASVGESAPSTREVGVMTPFAVRLVQECMDKDTSTEAVATCATGVMTAVSTRDIYIQTLRKRLMSTATGTDYAGQASKGTSTLPVTAVDSETSMPHVTYESRTTWTEAVVTSERATSTSGPARTEVATLTTQVLTSDFTAQMRPQSVTTGTTTTTTAAPVCVAHHQSQTQPSVCSRGTEPDPPTPGPPPSATLSPPTSASPPASTCDMATEMTPARSASRAVGPNSQMLSSRTTSTDTVNLVQVTDKETSTPVIKTVDEWTHTPQPQMINTGVTPPRPAILEVGVGTMPVTLMDQATYTEVVTLRESATETCVVVCDSETLTEKVTWCDAQTEAEISRQSQGTAMDVVGVADGGCMTDEVEQDPPPPPKEMRDWGSQCQAPVLQSKEVNTTRFRRKAKEAQTDYSYVECLLCQHPEKLEQLDTGKTFTDTSTDPSPPDTHDVATMALSCLASPPGLASTGVQTSATPLYDKSVCTSFDFEEDLACRPFLGLESQDAATSTESLPYIGLLSEIDVDELIVIPEANFELVSDSDEESVSMVDGETLTEMFDYVEVGTQTWLPPAGQETPAVEAGPAAVRPEEECSKHVVSIGVNTVPTVTFEKETSTPIRHLFSKGTMTFFVAKMDKATSTISQTRTTDGKLAPPCSLGGGRVVREASRHKAVNHKVTMTSRAEQRDMGVETDNTLMDGRITQCISKLRSVSERLNSPTLRKTLEGDAFFGQSFPANKQKDSSLLASPASPKLSNSPKSSHEDTNTRASPPKDAATEERQRQVQLHTLLAETDAVLKPKDLSPARKAQPITTLKPRSLVASWDNIDCASRSLPRHGSLDRQNKVRMGSQSTPSRLPLLRYNSAPGRIATVPAQTLLRKTGPTGPTSPRTSPSKIPVSQKPAGASSSTEQSDSGPDSDTYSTSSSQKVQQRPSLPSISETRTPSSCSETSYISIESGESSLNPPSVMTSSHSRTPSNVTSMSDTASEMTLTKESAEAVEAGQGQAEDSSSASSTCTTLAAPPAQAASPATAGSPGKQKKEKKGFMQRLLNSSKKKKDSGMGGEKEGQDGASASKQPPPAQPPPSSPQPQPKQPKKGQGAKSKSVSKPAGTSASSAPPAASRPPPPPPVSTSSGSRPSSSDSAQSCTKGGAAAAAPPAAAATGPAMPPHHYPPLPDPNKTPPAPRKPRPFVYVRQRIFSIQQDNVEEVKERKEKEKEEKDKVSDCVVS